MLHAHLITTNVGYCRCCCCSPCNDKRWVFLSLSHVHLMTTNVGHFVVVVVAVAPCSPYNDKRWVLPLLLLLHVHLVTTNVGYFCSCSMFTLGTSNSELLQVTLAPLFLRLPVRENAQPTVKAPCRSTAQFTANRVRNMPLVYSRKSIVQSIVILSQPCRRQ